MLSLFIPFWIPRYALVANIDRQTAIVKISRLKVFSILKTFDKIEEINGKDKPSPTPAPQSIAPMNNESNKTSKNLFLILNIPENVNLDFWLFVIANPNAIAGKQYIAQAVNDQWKIG